MAWSALGSFQIANSHLFVGLVARVSPGGAGLWCYASSRFSRLAPLGLTIPDAGVPHALRAFGLFVLASLV